MFNPPAALLASRIINGDATRAARQARVLDDPSRDPSAAASGEERAPASRRGPRSLIALVVPVRRLR